MTIAPMTEHTTTATSDAATGETTGEERACN